MTKRGSGSGSARPRKKPVKPAAGSPSPAAPGGAPWSGPSGERAPSRASVAARSRQPATITASVPPPPPSASAGATAPYADAPARPPGRQPGLRPFWWVLLPLLGALLCVGGLLAYDRYSPATYTAEALIAVLPDDPAADVSLQITAIWMEIGNSDGVLLETAGDLDIQARTLEDSLTLVQAGNAPLLSVQVTTGDADRAAEWANELSAQLLAESSGNPVPGYGLQAVTEALPPEQRDAAAGSVLLGAAVVAGLLLGLGAAELLSRRSRARATRRSA